ncbi:hypothetical protein CA606_18080 [Caulobacter vibrioides]|uniref:Uncharacterized protein n=1 Tax=Caulobacter vibrioides TaxID=155892 RepID=A0A290N2D5_CAUVI|nr:hypothetical protein [Caulobacter vibrioides]ATC34084.1 hypothetical protein CA606_18080 [Caulobacter vibrioides]
MSAAAILMSPAATQRALPETEIVVRSPIGDVRVWIDGDGLVRTSITADQTANDAAAGAVRDLGVLVERAQVAVRGLVTALGPQVRGAGLMTWLRARCDTSNPHARTPATVLFNDYVAFIESEGGQIMSRRAFGDALSSQGLPPAGKNAAGLKYRGGVVLKAQLEETSQ